MAKIPPKIKQAKSWRETPHPEYTSEVKAFTYPKSNTIFIRRDTAKSDIEHEEYHMQKRHPDRPRNSANYISQEIDATLYAYKKLGRPTHILGKLRAIFNDLTWCEYQISPTKALVLIKRKLFKTPQVPKSWRHDFLKLVREVKKAYPSTGRGNPRVTKGVMEKSVTVSPIQSTRMPKEVALAIGSYKAKVEPTGKIKLKVRRL